MTSMDVARQLADGVGSRPAGSPQEREAADLLEREFVQAGLNVVRQTFAFRTWQASGEWTLAIEHDGGAQRFDAVPLPYTNPESTSHLSGRLEWEGDWQLIPGRVTCPRFAVRDEDDEVIAAIIGSPSGAERPLPNPHPLLALPTVVVSTQAAERLRAAVGANGGRPAVEILGGSVSEGLSRSTNLIAGTAGVRPWLTLAAHYDCVAGSPGANDNATGVDLLLRLARRLGWRDEVRFLLFGAEEPFIAGSRAYVASAANRDALAECRASLNLDMVAVGDRFAVRCVGGSLWSRAFDRLADASPAGVPLVRTDLYAASDHWAFHEVGIPSAQLTREPDAAWHSGDDTSERFDAAALDDAEAVATALIESLRSELAGNAA